MLVVDNGFQIPLEIHGVTALHVLIPESASDVCKMDGPASHSGGDDLLLKCGQVRFSGSATGELKAGVEIYNYWSRQSYPEGGGLDKEAHVTHFSSIDVMVQPLMTQLMNIMFLVASKRTCGASLSLVEQDKIRDQEVLRSRWSALIGMFDKPVNKISL